MTGIGLRGRRLAQALLVAAVLLGVIPALVALMLPPVSGPMFEGPPVGLGTAVFVLGGGMYLFGLGLMVRFYRATFESSRSSFRATRRR